jgi:hypothetical protein
MIGRIVELANGNIEGLIEPYVIYSENRLYMSLEEKLLKKSILISYKKNSILDQRNEINNQYIAFTIKSNLLNMFNRNPILEAKRITFENDLIIGESVIDRDECSICLDDIKIGDTICKTSCNHYFHHSCLINWIRSYDINCPYCRKELIKIEQEDFEFNEENKIYL